VIATLGRIDELQESGQSERLLRSGARFSEKAIVLDALERGEATAISTRRIGPRSPSSGYGRRPAAAA
jgi:hypothetical protein